MTNDEIVAAFVCPEVFPAAALELASQRREEIAPRLIAEIADCASGLRSGIRGFYYLTSFACLLLAEWRDPRAFKPLLSLLASPHQEELGDTITECMSGVLARTFDGDAVALQALVLNEDAGEFVRDAAIEAYALLVQEGRIARHDAQAFLLEIFACLPHRTDFAWNAWIAAVARLQFDDLVPQVKQLFDEESIDMTWMDYEDFEEMVAASRGGAIEPAQLAYRSPIEEMRRWIYSPAEDESEYGLEDEEIDRLALSAFEGIPTLNPFKHIGRNDSCPCGSGQKFKKCCLPKSEAGLL